MLTDFSQDVRFALRSLRRHPALASAVLAAIALAIGANTAIFAVVNGVLLRPLPYAEPEKLVRVYQLEPPPSQALAPLSPPNFFDWRERSTSVSAAAAYWSPQVTLTGAGDPEHLLAATATHELFALLHAPVAHGRVYGPEDDRPGAEPVVVLSDGLWQRRFGGDTALLGRTISLNGRPHTVIGVMASSFRFPRPGTELWLPMQLEREADADEIGMSYRAFRILEVIARLADGATVERARSEAVATAARLATEYPDENAGFGAAVVPLLEVEVGEARPGLLALQASVFLLLVIACANLSSVMLARSAARSRELAVRVALGASPARLTRQLLVESAIVAALGGALGAAVAAGVIRALRASTSTGLPRIDTVSVDATVIAFSALATLATGLALGVGPAMRAAARDLYAALRAGVVADATPRHVRARRLLVVAQIAVAAVLLVSAGLLVRSLERMLRTDPGFRSEGVPVVARLSLPRSRYAEPERVAAFYEALLARVEALPGVESAAVSIGVPLGPDARFFVDRTGLELEGAPPQPPGRRPAAAIHVVSPRIFDVLRIPIVVGRAFDARDSRRAPPVAIINEVLARQLFGDADPVGRRLRHEMRLPPGEPGDRTIVGVVGDVRHFSLGEPPEPQIYVPHVQSAWPSMHLMVRAAGDAARLAPAVRAAVGALDADIPVPPLVSLADVSGSALVRPRLQTGLLALFAGTALAVACLGLYGLMAYSVSSRSRETGVRLALGAGRREVVRMVVVEGMGLALLGLGLGLIGSAASTRILSSLLDGTGAFDPVAFVTAASLLGVVALLACWVPARAAARIDPLTAIRAE
ncbi:MAG TPA: ABC transporter permease [Vicinamibacterales bacterium]|nr:ABC transporter permease [Vicinamibacterales bacterium]